MQAGRDINKSGSEMGTILVIGDGLLITEFTDRMVE
jgi:hypothetical protein